jgi:hypothetical protein
MLPRIAARLGLVCGLVLAGPGSAVVGSQQLTQSGSNQERIIRRQTLDIEVQYQIRDQAELGELTHQLIASDADEVTGLAAKRLLRECQRKRRWSQQGLLPPADTRRPCEPDIQLWSMSGSQDRIL